MKIYIKNMVCNRCSLAVINLLNELGLEYYSVSLGEINFDDSDPSQLTFDMKNKLQAELEALGFSILSDQKSKTIESVKLYCLEYIEKIADFEDIKLSEYLSKSIKLEYNYLSHMFSVVEGITIEKYFIRLRMEKVKELLVYDEVSISEIAFHLGFSNVAHLSSQFKKYTGLTPGYFRSLKNEKLRVPLDNL